MRRYPLLLAALCAGCYVLGYGVAYMHESSRQQHGSGAGHGGMSVAAAAARALRNGAHSARASDGSARPATLGEGGALAGGAPHGASAPPHGAPPAPAPHAEPPPAPAPLAPEDALAAAALAQLLEHPMAGCPAAWLTKLDEYAAWHAAQLQLIAQRSPLAARVMVYSCAETVDETIVVGDDCGGYADRLVGVSHLFLFSLLYKFVFLVDWSSGGLQLPPHVFHSPFINYTFDERVVLGANRSVELRERHFNGCPDHQGPCVLQHADPPAQFTKDVTLTRINKGGVRYSTDAVRARLWSELGLLPDNVGGCVLRALVQPNRHTVDAFREWAHRLLDPAVHVVALHVRTGDKAMHQLEAPKEGFGTGDKYWTCALKLRAEAQGAIDSGALLHKVPAMGAAAGAADGGGGARLRKAVVFVSADDSRYKASGIAAHGRDAVWATDVRPWHISKLQLWWDGFIHRKDKFPNPIERLRDTFGEWWLLSLSDDFVMPGFSGYSRTAFAYSQKPAGRNVENYEGRGLCCCDNKLGQKDLAYLGGSY